MGLHLTGGQALVHQLDDQIVDPDQPALALADQLRLEAAGPVPRHVDLHRADVGEHRLGPVAVAAVVRADPLMRLVAQLPVSSASSAVSNTVLVTPDNSPPPRPGSPRPPSREGVTRCVFSPFCYSPGPGALCEQVGSGLGCGGTAGVLAAAGLDGVAVGGQASAGGQVEAPAVGVTGEDAGVVDLAEAGQVGS